MGKGNIFAVDDEEDILELIRMNLEKEGYKVTSIGTGEECLKKSREKIPDLILLDLMLPGIDGLDVCRTLKNDSKTRHIPIIMLTAKGEESDIVTGLELGADDYITKPFSMKVLLARIKSVIRKGTAPAATGSAEVIKRRNMVIDPGRREVTVGGKAIELTFTEFEVLAFLARRPGWVFTRNQIVEGVKGGGYPVTERAVDVQIVGLRKKLGAAAELIDTIRGVGYKFMDR
ncbi:MAG TPA: DNA-binding response regulator [Lentisphaeria bacterium]|nr:MAG: DNA-binding response regulator [Lentisphaerae bacterium GWF2_49_21]HBC87986.1 DNA-binding response regulator [Lentisphaeria bacterium]